MLETIRSILFALGVNAAAVPDWMIAVAVIIVLIILLRVVLEILEQILSIGCTVVSLIVIALLLFEVFG